MNVVSFLAVFMLACGTLSASLLDDLGIDSEASRMVRNQSYAPKTVPYPPAQHSSAEGLPPLPLPVVPLRRTEKKNPPRPPVLIAKLSTRDRLDWATSPEDTKKLLQYLAHNMGVHFSTINLPQESIPDNAGNIPVLYRSGIRSFSFSDSERGKLRSYLLNGGTLVFNAYCGNPDFAISAFQEMQNLIPERPPYRLLGDHPLYRSYYDIKDIRYRPLTKEAGARDGIPSVIGIDINTRTAVFLFRYDLSTAWEHMSSDQLHILGYTPETAEHIGANLMAYITAERSAAIPLSKAMSFVDSEPDESGKLTIAQVRYDGLWKTRDSGLSMLLDVFHRQTKIPVRFKGITVELDNSEIFDQPLLYLTGTNTFRFTHQERSNLRQYLYRGGILFVEASCGRHSFDEAFRREIGQVLPNSQLTRIPDNHTLFNYPNRVREVHPRPALAHHLKEQSNTVRPFLYGIMIEGRLVVIYSPHDLSGGWALAQGPYNYGIQSKDAFTIGVNVLSYALLQ